MAKKWLKIGPKWSKMTKMVTFLVVFHAFRQKGIFFLYKRYFEKKIKIYKSIRKNTSFCLLQNFLPKIHFSSYRHSQNKFYFKHAKKCEISIIYGLIKINFILNRKIKNAKFLFPFMGRKREYRILFRFSLFLFTGGYNARI